MTRSARLLVALVSTLVLLAACSAPSGTLGPPATPPPSDVPSLEPGSPEPTPMPSASSPDPTQPDVTPPSPPATPPPSATPTPAASPAGTTIIRAYFMLGSSTGDPGLAPVLREVPKTVAVGTAAMQQLLVGPSARERAADPALTSAIPAGTRLLGLRIDDRIATVDLSREFESGGSSASVFARLAQVVYTLTQFPTVDAVRFELDGEPVTVFSGEGVILDQPVGREDYTEQLSLVFIDRPAWGAALGNPGRVSGLSNAFEGTSQVQLLDAAGRVLAKATVMATCGMGCWGTWSTELRYDVPSAQWGTLRAFEYSARDGSEINVTEYPVWLTPAG
jgi:germination protein M